MCVMSWAPPFCAWSVAVRASILRSSSATRLSAFFCRFRVGGVVILVLSVYERWSGCGERGTHQGRLAFAQRRQDTSGRSWSQRTWLWSMPAQLHKQQDHLTFRPRHESHARGRLKSPGDFPEPGVAWALWVVSETRWPPSSCAYPSWSPSCSMSSSSSGEPSWSAGDASAKAGSRLLCGALGASMGGGPCCVVGR